ncbi:IS110 family transposase, partial [Roseateles sp. LYH14W]
MDVIYPRCAGLDVHKQTVVACVRVAGATALVQEVRTFGTTTTDLLALADWLESFGVQQVAMEATGVYWKPVWHILEESFELILANAAHVKNVPGRKTDVNDSMWLADLLAHGLIRASFVPPAAVQELRTLTRTRKQFVRERAAHVQRIEKLLEDANIKLSSVITDIIGKSGRAVLKALIEGQTDPEQLLACVGRVKASRAELLEALRGRVSAHHRFMLKLHLGHIETLDQTIASIEKEVGQGLEPFRQAAKLLSTMPGISDVSANVVVAEIGIDMSRFPTPGHLL